VKTIDAAPDLNRPACFAFVLRQVKGPTTGTTCIWPLDFDPVNLYEIFPAQYSVGGAMRTFSF
jgi:hypothetical protein